MRILFSLFFILSFAFSASAGSDSHSFEPDTKWLRNEMRKMDLPRSFIDEALETYQKDTFETVLRLNLLGFLGTPNHMDRVTSQSVNESLSFIKENQKFFDRAEKKYKVPPQVISALLWIETRHGEEVGKFHIVSVYMHLLQADRARNREHLTAMALEKSQKNELDYSKKELKKLMAERTKKRYEWAREQLEALAQIHDDKKLDLRTLKGSYAGAFGLPQFIPSSYLDFAKPFRSRTSPDLRKEEDAIMSVAHYLSKHGWSNRKSESKISALMKYNNSRDYAESILEISKRVSKKCQTSFCRAQIAGGPY